MYFITDNSATDISVGLWHTHCIIATDIPVVHASQEVKVNLSNVKQVIALGWSDRQTDGRG